jgi:serine/threonine-protein kinase
MSDGAEGFDESELSKPDSGVSGAPEGLLGQTIDQRYRVETVLGEGGMGLVYRVTHTRLNKALAMKVLRRENTRDEEVLARFRREAESASAIGHQHIVDISDFGTLSDGSTYFVMECLEGMDLIDAMDLAQRMPEERAVHIGIQLCRALGAAHQAGIIHRDLKPENVFLTKRDGIEDFVKVLDFGIAKVANGHKRLTRAGEVLGTPHYMSPEQCEGEDVDHRTDIYALGVLLYEMVTGHVPHDADTMMGILTKHIYDDPIPPRVRVPQITEQLERVIMRCLDKKSERRYQTMCEVEADLERVRSGRQPRGPDVITLAPTRPPRPARRRAISPIYLGGLAIAALAALASTLSVAVSSDPSVGPQSARLVPPLEAPAAPPPPSEPNAPGAAGSEAKAHADAADQAVAPAAQPMPTEARALRSKPLRRKPPRAQAEPAPQANEVILDPWK